MVISIILWDRTISNLLLLVFINDKYYYDQCRNHLQWGELRDTLPNGQYTKYLKAPLKLTVLTEMI